MYIARWSTAYDVSNGPTCIFACLLRLDHVQTLYRVTIDDDDDRYSWSRTNRDVAEVADADRRRLREHRTKNCLHRKPCPSPPTHTAVQIADIPHHSCSIQLHRYTLSITARRPGLKGWGRKLQFSD